jgi:hypothetical protein
LSTVSKLILPIHFRTQVLFHPRWNAGMWGIKKSYQNCGSSLNPFLDDGINKTHLSITFNYRNVLSQHEAVSLQQPVKRNSKHLVQNFAFYIAQSKGMPQGL